MCLVERFDKMQADGGFKASYPNHGADTGVELEKLGRWTDAALAWRRGSQACLGHGRAARYLGRANYCAEKAKEVQNEQ